MDDTEAAIGVVLILAVYILIANLVALLLVAIIKPQPKAKNRFGRAAKPQNFGGAISICMNKYRDLSGRASRSEFWWFYLFSTLISIGLNVLDMVMKTNFFHYGSFGLLMPVLGVSIRRLHDINRSGWWVLLNLCVLPVVLYFLWSHKSQDDEAVAAVFE